MPCRLVSLAAPLVLQNVFGFSLSIIAAVFVGHLGDNVALACSVLAGSIYNVSGYSIVVGLSAGMDTLCGQVGMGIGCADFCPAKLLCTR